MSKHSQRHQKARTIRASLRLAVGELVTMAGPMVIEASAADGKSPPRFSGDLYTGGTLRVGKYPLPVVIDLAGLTGLDKPRPVFREHADEGGHEVGHMDHYQNDGNKLSIGGAISATTADAAEVLAMHRNGFPWQLSIEAMPDQQSLQMVSAGQAVQVNGRRIEGPVLVARRSKLIGAAVTNRGADDNTTFSIAASAAFPKSKEFVNMEFDKWVEALGLKTAELTEQQQVALKARYDADQAVIKAKADADAAIKGAAAAAVVPKPDVPAFDASAVIVAHAGHEATILAKAAEYDGKIGEADLAKIKAEHLKAAGAIKAKALTEKWAAPRIEAELIRASANCEVELIRAERPKGPAVHSSSRDMSAPVIEAALCRSAGLQGLEKQYDAKILEAADRQFRNLGLQELLLIQASANGYADRAYRIHRGNLSDVLKCAFAPVIRGSFSTVSLPGVFSNVANKFLIEGFNYVEQVWREIAAIRSVSDFKTVTSYRLTGDMAYEEVGAAGEIPHGTVGEDSFTNQAKTYAKMLGLTRQDIINDDLGAFDTLRQRLGRGAGLKLNSVFWTAFLNNASFFTTGRVNYVAGAGTALGHSSLATAEQMFLDLKDSDGNPAGGAATLLLVPTPLSATARNLYVAQEIRDTTASTKAPVANVFQNRFRPISSTYLGLASISGYSALAWYLLANPADRATIEVCFLDGQQSPTVESAEADFSTLGVEFRGYHDFGVALREWLGGVKLKGEA